GVPADRVSEGGGEGEEKTAREGLGRVAPVAVDEDEDGGDGENNAKDGERPSLEQVDQVVAEGRYQDLNYHDDQERQREGERERWEQRLQRERSADAVDDKPAERGDQGVEARGKDVAEEPECAAADHHHRRAELGSPRGEDAVCDRAQSSAQDDGERSLPEIEA